MAASLVSRHYPLLTPRPTHNSYDIPDELHDYINDRHPHVFAVAAKAYNCMMETVSQICTHVAHSHLTHHHYRLTQPRRTKA